ncbi:MAG: translation initiation factor IF-2 [Lachnospiraceae bacterium]|nr:translation initiation factor IF-2 [Lachnospiraceae bacterium]
MPPQGKASVRLGPDGKPLPPARRGPDGKPLPPVRRGPDGKPLPPVRLGPDGKPLPPVRLGPDGKPIAPARRPRPEGGTAPKREKTALSSEETAKETAMAPDTKPEEKEIVQTAPETMTAKQVESSAGVDAEKQVLKEQSAQIPPEEKTPSKPETEGQDAPVKSEKEKPAEQAAPKEAIPVTETSKQEAAKTQTAKTAPAAPKAPEAKPVRPLGTVLRRVNMNPEMPPSRPAAKRTGQGGRDASSRDGRNTSMQRDRKEGGRMASEGRYVSDRDNRRTDNTRSDGDRRQNSRGEAPARDSQAGRGPARQGAMAGGGKPMEKEGRRSERGSRGDRNKGMRAEKGDRFDRMEQRSRTTNAKNTGKGGKAPAKQVKPAPVVKEEEKIKSITIPETLTIKELADKLKIQPSAIVKKLFLQGKMVTVNEEVDFETAEEIAIEYEVICEKEVKVDVIEELLRDTEDPEESLVTRPPVVCVMGHVDHGKTSLLDAIRNTHVIDREAGGITQHIGASVVESSGRKITFLDTPGHEAFTAMRMRGAKSTDIAILVVAADDGVMPQTVEAINHAKAAGIEIIVAINKIDKPAANVDKVKQELTEYQLIPEDWGGSTVFCEVSAKTHEGIDNLLEMILLTAEVLELKANPNRRARGLVIEAQLDKGRGPVATVLVQKGTLHVGDSVCAGSFYGKVRAMLDDQRRSVKEAGPSTPVEIIGLSGVPNAGEIIISPTTEKEARSFAETFQREGRERMLEETKSKMSLDDLFTQIQAGSLKELNLIVKADVQGSVEAVKQSLLKLSNEEVVVKVIHSGAGTINESDVMLASASNAIIIGFNVKLDPQAKSTAEQEGVDVRLYSVIYDAIADVEAAMKGLLDPIFEEKILGHGEVRQTFRASGVGTIAGSYVLDGIFQRGCKARITRDGKQIFDGDVASLKRFKDDVKEVRAGYECGLVFDKFNDLAEGDQIEAYAMVEVPRT